MNLDEFEGIGRVQVRAQQSHVSIEIIQNHFLVVLQVKYSVAECKPNDYSNPCYINAISVTSTKNKKIEFGEHKDSQTGWVSGGPPCSFELLYYYLV